MTPRTEPTAPPETDTRDGGLDETIEETFPASDPPSTIPDPTPATPPPGSDDTRQARPARRWTDQRPCP
jgi:hypothetical protein